MKQFKLQNYYKNPQNIEVSESLSSLSMLNNLLTNYPTKAINSLSQLRVSQLEDYYFGYRCSCLYDTFCPSA